MRTRKPGLRKKRDLKTGELTQIEVESLSYSPRAVGKVDGFVVFVDGGVPGDRLLVRITQVKKNYAVAEAVEEERTVSRRSHATCGQALRDWPDALRLPRASGMEAIRGSVPAALVRRR